MISRALLLLLTLVAEAPPAGTCTIEGKVDLLADGESVEVNDVVVYVEGRREQGYTPTTHQILQRNRQFEPGVKVIRAGDTVQFINKDKIAHDVYSADTVNAFYSPASKVNVTTSRQFSQPGTVRIGCHIHKKMRADLLVVENAWFDDTVGADGRFRLANVPQGPVTLVVWEANGGTAKVELKSCNGHQQVGTITVTQQDPPLPLDTGGY